MSAVLRSPVPESDLAYVYNAHRPPRSVPLGLPELSLVRLLVPVVTFNGDPVEVEAVGTIVSVFGEGEAYDVEFTSPAGVAAVGASDVAPIES